MNECKIPPEGWSCSRGEGHSGPCAAYPTEYNPLHWDHVDGPNAPPEYVGPKPPSDFEKYPAAAAFGLITGDKPNE